VANFPLPIITGIGHDRDESILDMVSHTRVKTPTAAATLLIDHLKIVHDAINNAQESITLFTRQKLSTLNSQLSTLQEMLPKLFTIVKTRQEACIESLYMRILSCIRETVISSLGKINAFETRLPILTDRRLMTEKHRLQLMEEKAKNLDPTLLLQRGYSITTKNGKVVRYVEELQIGDDLETHLANGTVHSIVK
jgi:exodeoxyribonuclease VII large subunit